MHNGKKKPAPRPPLPVENPIRESRLGWVVGEAGRGRLLVDFPGNSLGPLAARTTVSLDEAAQEQAVALRQEAVLLFEGGDPARPLLIGLLQSSSETPLTDALLAEPLDELPTEARVDGRRVVIEGRDEIVLRCGKATLVLKRNGEVLLKGVNIRTDAEEVQRIRGGKVQIN